MESARLAGFALRRIEKNAFVGRAAVGAAKKVGTPVWKAFRKAPLDLGIPLGLVGLMGPAVVGWDSSKSYAGKKVVKGLANQVATTGHAARRNTQMLPLRPMEKKMSVSFSEEEVRAALRVRKHMEKQASIFRSVAKAGGKAGGDAGWTPDRIFAAGLALGAAGLTVGLGQQAAASAAGEASNQLHKATRTKRFKKMLKADPTLRDEPQAKTYFNIVDRSSPFVSSEPYIAAAAVRTMLETPSLKDGGVPNVGPRAIRELLDVQKARAETKYPWLSTRAPTGPGAKLPSPDIDGLG